jgi:hypothetical protein
MRGPCQFQIGSRRSIALLGLGLLGCSEPDWVTTVGTLHATSDRVVTLTAPAHVAAGEDFVVTVQTVGSSNCTRTERTDLSMDGSLARLVPYDQVPAGGAACFRDLRPFVHSHAVRLAVPGPASLRIVGSFGQGAEAVLDSVEVGIQVDS